MSVFLCRRLPLSRRPALAGRRVCAGGRVSLWASAGERDAGDPTRRERHRQLQHLVRGAYLFMDPVYLKGRPRWEGLSDSVNVWGPFSEILC